MSDNELSAINEVAAWLAQNPDKAAALKQNAIEDRDSLKTEAERQELEMLKAHFRDRLARAAKLKQQQAFDKAIIEFCFDNDLLDKNLLTELAQFKSQDHEQ